MSAATLCLVVCDVMNKAIMCGRSVCYAMSQPFLPFITEEHTNMAVTQGAQFQCKKKKKCLCCIDINNTTIRNHPTEIFTHFFASFFPGQLASPLEVPFKD